MELHNIATFSQNVQDAFGDQETYANFSRLMVDTAKGVQVGYSTHEANEAIREKFYSILGVDKNASRKDMRRAINRHKQEVFEVIEDTVEDLLVSGWGENPFFEQFVEIRNLNDGDTNEFYSEDKTVLTVSKVSGNHHDLSQNRICVVRTA